MFYKLRQKSKKTGKETVYVGYKYNGAEIIKSTGVKVLAQHFNTETGKISKLDAQAAEKQPQITLVKQLLEAAVHVLVSIGATPTAKAVGEAYDLKEKQEAEVDQEFDNLAADGENEIERLEREIAELERQLAEKKDYLNSLNHIFTTGYKKPFTEYVAAYKEKNPYNRKPSTLLTLDTLILLLKDFNPNLTIEEINSECLVSFQKHLIAKPLKNRTVRITIARLKVVYRYYADKLKIPIDTFKDFKSVDDLGNKKILYLNEAEIAAIEGLTNLTPRQRQVQQQFLFACETGLRHSDIHVGWGGVHGDYLKVTMKKTDRDVYVPYTEKAKAIMDGPYFPFKHIKTSNYDKVIKALCKRLKLFEKPVTITYYIGNNPVAETKPKWQLMSSHVARKTAINNWLAIGIAESVVAEWAGHKTTKMLHEHYQHKKAASDRELKKLLP
jgi:integrase